MLMMNVRKEQINSKVRSMLGKCRIAICYAEEITSLLCRLQNLVCMKKNFFVKKHYENFTVW